MRWRVSTAVRAVLTSCLFLFLLGCVFAHERRPAALPQPNPVEIGLYSFTDSGPPFHVYELFIVSPVSGGSSIQRISVAQPGIMCPPSADSRIVSRTIAKTPGELFGKTNPCKVPDKAPVDCVACPVYSAGTSVSAQVTCGSGTRTIRRFIPNEGFNWKPPRRDSWMVDLLRDVGYPVGVVSPFLIVESEEPPANDAYSGTLQEIGAGKYDLLFQGAGDKLSKAYLESKNSQHVPTVQVRSEPLQPERFVLPVYPSLARTARIEGAVSVKFVIDGTLGPSNIVFENGNPLLRAGVSEALSKWKFPPGSAGQKIQLVLEFRTDCPSSPTRVH
jgi:Gram-negative bacterial TonB protein C-terminal